MREYEVNNRGHKWVTEEDGDIDIFAYNPSEYHNGPRCEACGYGFCHHCQSLPDCDCTAIVDAVLVDLPAELPARVKAG